jgi:pimeloyl-ACP methyl ester carboxylesterase
VTQGPDPAPATAVPPLEQSSVQLPGGRPRLAVRSATGPGRAFLLVHGLASNARLWDGVAGHLRRAGHAVVAVDQRGHGLSDQPPDGYDTDTCADDLAALIGVLFAAGDGSGPGGSGPGGSGPGGSVRRPVVVGQSWGGNVVLSLAARHPGLVAGVCCVDGGWIRPADRFATFEECWAALEPPRFDSLRHADVAARIRAAQAGWPDGGAEATLANLVELPGGGVRARLSREHHREIVRSLYQEDPRAWYPRIQVPVLLCPAARPDPAPDEGDDDTAQRAGATRRAVADAVRNLADAEVSWYPGAHHDLHAEQPARLTADLLALARRIEARDAVEAPPAVEAHAADEAVGTPDAVDANRAAAEEATEGRG